MAIGRSKQRSSRRAERFAGLNPANGFPGLTGFDSERRVMERSKVLTGKIVNIFRAPLRMAA